MPFTVPPITRLPGAFSTGIGSPVTSDSSTELDPSSHDAIDGNFFAGAHAQRVAGCDVLDGHVDFGAVGADQARGSRRKFEQRANRGGGAAARAQFEHLPEKHERGDRGGGFEIDGNLRPSVRNEAGKIPGTARRSTL